MEEGEKVGGRGEGGEEKDGEEGEGGGVRMGRRRSEEEEE